MPDTPPPPVAEVDAALAPDLAPRRVSAEWKWFDGMTYWWVTTFHPIGWNGLGERVGYERWAWSGCSGTVRERYVSESNRAKEFK